MAPKKEQFKKEEPVPLTAVILADTFDKRFFPYTLRERCWCLQELCNVPAIDYTLSWIARTEVQRIIIVVSDKFKDELALVQKAWARFFDDFSLVVCQEAMSVGEALRELDSRRLLTSDFVLLTNPLTITSSTLQAQIKRFRERRREDKNNVMTLIYSHQKNSSNAAIVINKETKQLRIYHRHDDPSRLDIDKNLFISNSEIRCDITDTGIALCSLNISAAFTDNFDFLHRDDVIREILVNEEVLLQKIHVDVLLPEEAAFTVTDYESLLILNTLILERWFYPIVPERMISSSYRNYGLFASECKKYNGIDKTLLGTLTPLVASFEGETVSIGTECAIGDNVYLENSSIGNSTKIGSTTQISNCIIGSDCIIGANCHLRNAVIGNHVTIPDNTDLTDFAVISANVKYPAEFVYPTNAAICSVSPAEEIEEDFKDEKRKGVHVWRRTDGKSFWKATDVARAANSVIKRSSLESDEEFSADDIDESEVELEPLAQFLEDITENMERTQSLEFTEEKIGNLILEINSSKLANNISMQDVANKVFYAFLGLPGTETLGGFNALATKWRSLFSNYYGPRQNQIQLLLALEERYKENPSAWKDRLMKTVMLLYKEDALNVLEEESILEWFSGLPEDSNVRPLLQQFIDIIGSDDEDEDEEEEEDDEA